MSGETDLEVLLRTMRPTLNPGAYVFCTAKSLTGVNMEDVVLMFREEEGITLVMDQEIADRSGFDYSFVADWITLKVHSALEAVGLTAAFSRALSDNGISCNVVAAFYHDHIFVRKGDGERAMEVLRKLSGPGSVSDHSS